MNRQFYFIIDKDKEKMLFDQIESRFDCKFFSYFMTEDVPIPNDVFLVVPCVYEEYIKYIDTNDNIKGKKIYPFDESQNMIPAFEYSHEDIDYADDTLLCRIYLSSNMSDGWKKDLKRMFNDLHRLIKKHSKKIRIDGMNVYYLNDVF